MGMDCQPDSFRGQLAGGHARGLGPGEGEPAGGGVQEGLFSRRRVSEFGTSRRTPTMVLHPLCAVFQQGALSVSSCPNSQALCDKGTLVLAYILSIAIIMVTRVLSFVKCLLTCQALCLEA